MKKIGYLSLPRNSGLDTRLGNVLPNIFWFLYPIQLHRLLFENMAGHALSKSTIQHTLTCYGSSEPHALARKEPGIPPTSARDNIQTHAYLDFL